MEKSTFKVDAYVSSGKPELNQIDSTAQFCVLNFTSGGLGIETFETDTEALERVRQLQNELGSLAILFMEIKKTWRVKWEAVEPR